LTPAVSEAAGAALPASFRDPSGFVFRRDGEVLRQVNPAYREHFDRLVGSGLYAALARDRLLLPHEELPAPAGAYKVLRPEQVPFISYPYEWSFGQLKDAALLTLELQMRALAHGMSLRDASAYNVQFVGGRPVFIDTLSFEVLREGQPWVAYGQFCRHFLAPLALMARVDVRLSQLLRSHIDGVPLDLASRLLPWRTRLSPGLGIHLHLHAKSQTRFSGETQGKSKVRAISLHQLRAIADSLTSTVRGLDWQPGGTEWFDYYEANNNYGDALREKEKLVGEFLDRARPKRVWDLGGNTGRFSRLAAARGAQVVCWDLDPGCVETNYRHVRAHDEAGVLPLLLDLTNPSPGLGWAHAERDALADRGPADTVLALGLVHHLAISNNVPLDRVAAYLARLARTLVIEFVPKQDSQVRKLLATREDVFPDYDEAGLERALAPHFSIERRAPIPGTARTLYLATGRA
jgi:ribosomal protein L11 methylase PrmA